ncbi:MAG: twin-arginine translocation signal domain-containing protein [Draconibacterium sp.]
MKNENRRNFLKSIAGAGAATTLGTSFPLTGASLPSETNFIETENEERFIVPKAQGIKITGTFLDEINDIPHQNWEKRMGQRLFSHESNGIDTVIMICLVPEIYNLSIRIPIEKTQLLHSIS